MVKTGLTKSKEPVFGAKGVKPFRVEKTALLFQNKHYCPFMKQSWGHSLGPTYSMEPEPSGTESMEPKESATKSKEPIFDAKGLEPIKVEENNVEAVKMKTVNSKPCLQKVVFRINLEPMNQNSSTHYFS